LEQKRASKNESIGIFFSRQAGGSFLFYAIECHRKTIVKPIKENIYFLWGYPKALRKSNFIFQAHK